MGLSRTVSVSEIDGDFSQKSQKNSHPFVFCTPAKRVPLELGIGAGVKKKLEWWGYWAEKEVWRYLQPSR